MYLPADAFSYWHLMMIPWRTMTGQAVSAPTCSCSVLVLHVRHPRFSRFNYALPQILSTGRLPWIADHLFFAPAFLSHLQQGTSYPAARAHTAPFVPSNPPRRCHLFLFKDGPQGQPPQQCPHWHFSISPPERPSFAHPAHLSTRRRPNHLARGRTERRPWV